MGGILNETPHSQEQVRVEHLLLIKVLDENLDGAEGVTKWRP
jgi:hypothetical protein